MWVFATDDDGESDFTDLRKIGVFGSIGEAEKRARDLAFKYNQGRPLPERQATGIRRLTLDEEE